MTALEKREERRRRRRRHHRRNQRVVDLLLVVQELGAQRRDANAVADLLDRRDGVLEVANCIGALRCKTAEPVQRLPFLFRRPQLAGERERGGKVLRGARRAAGPKRGFTTIQAAVQHLAAVPDPCRTLERRRETALRLVVAAEVERQHDAAVLDRVQFAIEVVIAGEQRPRLVIGTERLDRIAEPAIQHAEVDEHLRALARPQFGAGAELPVNAERLVVAPEPLVKRRLVRQQQTAAACHPRSRRRRRRERQRLVVQPARVGIPPEVELDVGQVSDLLGLPFEEAAGGGTGNGGREQALRVLIVARIERRQTVAVQRQRSLREIAEPLEYLGGAGGMATGIRILALSGLDCGEPQQGLAALGLLR
jgi:hypothetical protein